MLSQGPLWIVFEGGMGVVYDSDGNNIVVEAQLLDDLHILI